MFEHIVDVTKGVIESGGYLGICLLMALESMIFPLPSEAVMPFGGFLVAEGRMSWLGVFVSSTMGSLIGSWLSYWMGLYGGRPFLQKFGKLFLLDAHHLELTERFFVRHGSKAVLISRFIPIVRHLISIPAGTAKMNAFSFTLYTAIGATCWNMFLAWTGYVLERNWQTIKQYTHWLDYVILIGLVVSVLFFVVKKLRKAKSESPEVQK